ncbi:MAG: hypothetical protein ACFE0Q_03365 [Anaerolineae bacterium]
MVDSSQSQNLENQQNQARADEIQRQQEQSSGFGYKFIFAGIIFGGIAGYVSAPEMGWDPAVATIVFAIGGGIMGVLAYIMIGIAVVLIGLYLLYQLVIYGFGLLFS